MITLPASVRRVIINMQGGLGNQMFHMAFGMALEASNSIKVEYVKIYEPLFSKKRNTPRKLDIRQFASTKSAPIRVFRPLITRTEFSEAVGKISDGCSFATTLESSKYLSASTDLEVEILGFDGYWQNHQYFNHIERKVIEHFQTLTSESSDFLNLKSQIAEGVSIGMHIRRGDYISNVKTHSFHGACSLEYFKTALNDLRNTIKSKTLYIFTDDPEWASKNFSESDNVVVSNYSRLSSAEEMILLSQCSHLILSNSSFSWWAAYLREMNGNERPTVIAPSPWFADSRFSSPCLPHWHRLHIATGQHVL